MPQPPMSERMFLRTKMLKNMPILVPNPTVFSVNDVTIGIVNTDVIKDMCINMCIKSSNSEENKPKIELVLESMLQ